MTLPKLTTLTDGQINVPPAKPQATWFKSDDHAFYHRDFDNADTPERILWRPGDYVHRIGYDRDKRKVTGPAVVKIIRVTATQIVIEGGARFKRRSGRYRGNPGNDCPELIPIRPRAAPQDGLETVLMPKQGRGQGQDSKALESQDSGNGGAE